MFFFDTFRHLAAGWGDLQRIGVASLPHSSFLLGEVAVGVGEGGCRKADGEGGGGGLRE